MTKPDYAHKQTEKELEALERRISTEYGKAAKELQGKIDDYFAKFEKRDEETKKLIGTIVNGKEYTEQDYKMWRVTQIGRGKRFEALRDAMAERMTHANEIAIAYVNGEIPKIYALNQRYEIKDAIKDADGMLDGIDFTLIDEHEIKRLLVEQPDLMPYYPEEKAIKRGIDLAYGKRKITENITSGLLQGKGTRKIAADLMRDIPDMNRKSAIRAARTAVTESANAGRQAADEQLAEKGVILEKVWRCSFKNTRDPHAEAEGQTVPYDKPFTVGGEKLMFPGDHSMGASGWNLYNCQCTTDRKIIGFKSVLTDKQRKKANIRVVKG